MPPAETGQTILTTPPRTPKYQSCKLQVASQWPGDVLELVVDLEDIAEVLDDTMFIAALDVFHVRAAIDHRQARTHRLRLGAGIDNRLVGLGVAHDRGQDEKCVFPFTL